MGQWESSALSLISNYCFYDPKMKQHLSTEGQATGVDPFLELCWPHTAAKIFSFPSSWHQREVSPLSVHIILTFLPWVNEQNILSDPGCLMSISPAGEELR